MSDSAGDISKPRVVVLGGCGFIGRNLVEYLITEDLVSALRVVDKTPPQLAFLNQAHTKVFEDPRVEYKSANLINQKSCAAALEGTWPLVVNCAGETRCGQSEAVYAEGILALSTNVARRCAQLGVQRLVEVSSGHVGSSARPLAESDVPAGQEEPWTVEARMKVAVEAELRALQPDLAWTVLRPAIVYGIADRRSLTPRLLLGGIYRHLGETMRLLWTGALRLHTVHVRDACRAAWAALTEPAALHQVYHVVDEADSTQGSLAAILADMFHIHYDYYGTAISTLAKRDIGEVSSAANDKHLSAWADICRRYGIAHSPLEPSAPPDLLLNKHLCLDGTKLRALLPTLDHPRPTKRLLTEVLEDYAAMGLFPKELLL